MMNGYLTLLTLFFFFAAPLSLDARLSFGTGEYLNGVISARLWGLGPTVFWAMGRREDGTLTLTLAGKPEQPGAQPDLGRAYRGALAFFRAYRNANRAKAILKRTVRIEKLKIVCAVGLSDASATALLSGALLAASAAAARGGAPVASVRADFRGASRVTARCIISARLGMLLCAGICFFFAYLGAKRRVKGNERWKKHTSGA